MNSGLRREIINLVASGVLILILGALTGYTLELLIAGLTGYIAWHLYNLSKLIKWLSKPTKALPKSIGIWDELYYKIYHLYQRQRKARKKLKTIADRFRNTTHALPIAAIALNKSNEIEFTNYIMEKDFQEMIELEFNHRQLSICITPYGHDQFLLTATDITQQRQLDDMRRDFVANASHELRTPLTVISGFVEALCDQADSKIKTPLEKIRQQTVRMQQILDDLIVLARLESRLAPLLHDRVDLEELVQQIYNDAVMIDHDRHEIILSTQPASIMGNSVELQMAMTNLVTNAIRYTPENGTITLFVSVDNDGVHVGVEDNGIGIMPEHIGRLTERFYRVDPGRSREQGGTGLGLAIVKHVLDRHDASLHVHSVPGEGSLFRCDFELFEHGEEEKAA